MHRPNPGLEAFVRDAWKRGQSFDFSDVRRGKVQVGVVPPYYYFLAGVSAVSRVRTAVEIGTNYGGSAIALKKGSPREDFRCVTADIEDFASDQLDGFDDIEQVIGDANSMEAVCRIASSIEAPIDLLFIDTKHDFDTTMRSFGIYFSLLKPRICIFDDITLNNQMEHFWALLVERFGEFSMNVVDIIPAIREHPKNPGFGILMDPDYLKSIGDY